MFMEGDALRRLNVTGDEPFSILMNNAVLMIFLKLKFTLVTPFLKLNQPNKTKV